MNHPTPAIVAQGAVRRLPRVALLLFCVAYVLPGLLGREPWKGADMAAFGYMVELARGSTDWLAPQLMGLPPEVDGLLPYWLGAWALQLAPAWFAPDFAARIPFGLLLVLTMLATWWGTYYLALSPKAQPVAFAFGGEALPPDYARAMADGGLLALIACLGLAQLSHETTPALVQLCSSALLFYAFSALPFRTMVPALCGLAGLVGLTLSGAPSMAILLGAGGALVHGLDRARHARQKGLHIGRWVIGIAVLTLLVAVLTTVMDLWHWRIEIPPLQWLPWRNLGRLLLWFTWPAWPLVLWTLWRWRHQIASGELSRHLALPLWFVAVAVGTTLVTTSSDRSLLLALPAMAALAAFALPTLERSVAALIDWFTLLFFTGCAIIIWVVWIAMQTGVPAQPAANVMRLAPGFEASFSFPLFLLAALATLAWGWLVKWRVGRHRAAIWKSLVLPAGGAALSWLLLMTLWLPLLDYARSYVPLVRQVTTIMQHPACVQTYGLSRGQVAALRFYGELELTTSDKPGSCDWLIVNGEQIDRLPPSLNLRRWDYRGRVEHPVDRDVNVLLYKRILAP
ncbi:MAG: hypothetical protein KJ852_07700 [Gammaproteobacteria bacterium]|nr:hypothetical protein [Gammaproteobacteria bacterium]MBU0786078.1 hypothetical protein [Gammaproteobacteria bacterium]MBU0816658.1 hypothetical protein [Gammaproteobacteria bacterium]MBU1786822.1 hypothetical protein [Gammaproteobacteria bacterium]